MLTRILGAIDEYVYVGEILPDDGYELLFQGPCRAQLLGIEDPEQARAAVWAEHVHPDDRELFRTLHRDALTGGQLDGQYRLVGADGVQRWVRDRGRIRHEGGRSFLDGSVLDVTAIQAARQELEAAHAEADRRGRLDPLTGVANRRVLPELLDRRLERGEPGVGVLLLDIDRFKAINDAYGHAAGDAVLVEVADRVRRTIREDDAVARIGGEEFLVLLHGMSHAETLRRVGEAIRIAVRARPIAAAGSAIAVTVSIGAAVSDGDHALSETLLAAADRALYAAKESTRDRVVLEGDAPAPRATRPDLPGRETAGALAVALEARAGVAPGRIEAFAALAAATGDRLAGRSPLGGRCRLVALVHDVGQIALPEWLFAPDAALDVGDRAVLQRHSALGEAMLRRMPELAAFAPAVRHHHERFDGTGYPDGLAGEAIPLEARIVSVVDAYAALGGAGLIDREAVLELERMAGAALDPAAVAAFTAVLSA